MAEALVELSAVSKKYRRGGPMVLDQVELRLERGTLTQVRGENGSGKSTLLRVASGLGRASSGKVHRNFTRLGFVPDRVAPPPRMTARTYLAHMSRLAGLASRTAAPAAEALAHRLALSPGLDVPLGALSRGNLRKVILAQALMRPVDLLVMDEPFTALDDTASAELAAIVEQHLARGCTFLIASHSDALDHLGRNLTLRAGRLLDFSDAATAPGPRHLSIELCGPQPSSWSGQRCNDGTTRYLVPVGKGELFLHDALAAGSQVLRLNPVDDPEEPNPGVAP